MMIRYRLAAVAALLTIGAAPPDTPPQNPAVTTPDMMGGAAPLVAVTAFAERPFLSRLVLSPDGKRIAATATVKGTNKLAIYKVGDMAEPRVVELGDVGVLDLNWAGSNRLLMTVSTTAKYNGTPIPISRLFAIDAMNGATTRLDAKSGGILAGDVLYTDPDGGWALVASQDDVYSTPSVKRIDLATGAVVKVERERPDVWNWFADRQGVVRAGIAYDNDRWTMWYRATPDAPLKPIRRKDKPSGDGGAVDGVRFLTDPGHGMILTNARTGRFAAYKYDFDTGVIGDAIYENPLVDITGVVSDPRTGDIAGISYTDDRYHIAWLDPENKAIQARLDRALPRAENIIVSSSRDGNHMLVWSGAGNNPGTYFIYDRAARTMKAVAQPYAMLAQAPLAPVEPVRYAARDGLSIPGYLTLPLGRPAKGLPLIVMPHGGPFVRDTWDYDPFVQFLANRGYAVLQPNFRGSTGYGKDFVEKGYGQWGRAMQDDIDDGVDWLVKSGQVDGKRVCIMGASYGGYAALWGAIRNPEHYRCAVSLAGVTDLPGMLRFDRKSFSAPRYFKSWQKKVQGEDKTADLDLVSPLAQADRLTVPVFIAHGEKDDNVPAKQAHQMIAALKKRNFAVDSAFYPTAKHGLQSSEDLADFLTRLEAFLKKNNPS